MFKLSIIVVKTVGWARKPQKKKVSKPWVEIVLWTGVVAVLLAARVLLVIVVIVRNLTCFVVKVSTFSFLFDFSTFVGCNISSSSSRSCSDINYTNVSFIKNSICKYFQNQVEWGSEVFFTRKKSLLVLRIDVLIHLLGLNK